MNGNWYVSYLVEVRRRQEEIAQAQQEQLAKLAIQTTVGEKGPSMFQRWLNTLGVILATWGCRLQKQSCPESFITTTEGSFVRVKTDR
jgi:hypothetical protein